MKMTGEQGGGGTDALVGNDTASIVQGGECVNQAILQLLTSAAITEASLLSAPFPLVHVTKVDLPNCDLSELPPSLPEALPNLSILFLSQNRFKALPPVIGRCPRLTMVAFKSNGMTKIHPDALQPQMRWLILTDNQLAHLPATIGRCSNLQKLMLSGNQLTELPEELSQCRNLELIRLASNRLVELPLNVLHALPRLCWIGLSQNPFLAEADKLSTTRSPLPVLDIDDHFGELLGQGAGGVVRKVRWNDRFVAVKTFTGAMTSDGLAQEERNISCAVSQACRAPCFVQVLGETAEGSLVFEYLPNYRALASPPSLKSCSRDVYDNNQIRLSYEQVLSMISVLLQGLVELHRASICHGDFYAHNVLLDESGDFVRLTDFGAAFPYDRQAPYGQLVERIEMRAFAVLVEELIEHVLIRDDTAKATLLTDFVQVCRQSAETEQGFEATLIWWKQRRLQSLAKELEVELDL